MRRNSCAVEQQLLPAVVFFFLLFMHAQSQLPLPGATVRYVQELGKKGWASCVMACSKNNQRLTFALCNSASVAAAAAKIGHTLESFRL
jgi:hypothetical protein